MVKKVKKIFNNTARAFCFCGVVFFILNTQAQSNYDKYDTTKYFKEKIALRANLLYLGASVEFSFYKNLTLYNQVAFPWGVMGSQSQNQNHSKIIFTPTYHSSVRWYYNTKRRIEKNKNVRYFSGNYISLLAGISLDRRIKPSSSTAVTAFIVPYDYLGIHYGLQRNFRRHWFWNVSVGGGLKYNKHVPPVLKTIYVEMGLGYTF
jgi:hypothetical protein